MEDAFAYFIPLFHKEVSTYLSCRHVRVGIPLTEQQIKKFLNDDTTIEEHIRALVEFVNEKENGALVALDEVYEEKDIELPEWIYKYSSFDVLEKYVFHESVVEEMNQARLFAEKVKKLNEISRQMDARKAFKKFVRSKNPELFASLPAIVKGDTHGERLKKVSEVNKVLNAYIRENREEYEKFCESFTE